MDKKIKIDKALIHRISKNSRKKASFWKGLFLGNDKNYIIENLTLMADSGMGILSALDAIGQGSSSKRVKKIVNQIKVDAESGSPLWEALEFSGLFPEKAISLIVNGFCKEVFKTLPLEFSVEAVKLIEMKLENSVG